MADVFGRIGSEDVELNNAATESTLKLLLASSMAANKQELDQLKKLAGMAGINSEAWESAEQAVEKTATKMEKFDGALTLVQKGFNELRPVLGAFQSAMGSIVSGSNNLSDVYRAFSVLPGPLGLIASGFAYLQKLQEESFASYQKMTEAGVNFGGDINKLRVQASQMGLSLDQMSEFVNKNSEALARMGGGTDKAMRSFQKLSTDMINSETGDRLRALGFTTEQVNQGMLNYIKFTGGRTSKEMENTGALIASSSAYMETLDGLARVTGMSRDQQQAALDEASKNAAWQARLAGMTDEEKKKAIEGMAKALALGGKGAVDAFQSKIMGVAPDKAGQLFIATADRTASVVDSLADSVFDKSKDVDDQNKLFVQGMRAAQIDMAKYGKETLFAILRAGGPMADALQQMGINANKAATMSDAEIAKALAKVEIDKSAAAAEVANQKAMQKARDELVNALNQLRVEFGPQMIQAARWLMQTFKDIAEWGKQSHDNLKLMAGAAIGAWAAFKLFEGAKAILEFRSLLKAGTVAGGAATTVAGGAATAAGGAGLGASIVEVGTAIAAVGRMGHWVLLGAAAIGGAITLVGAGIAGAIWLTGKALPTFSDGILSFNRIEGGKLVDVAKGIAALGGAMAVFGATGALGGAGNILGSMFSGLAGLWKGDIISKVEDSVNRLTPIIPRLAILGPAMQAFGQGMMAYGQAVNTIDIGKADKVADLMKKPAVAAAIADLGKQALTVNAGAATGTTDQKALQAAIIQLNNTMADIKRYMASTSENTGRAITELRALNPNSLPRP